MRAFLATLITVVNLAAAGQHGPSWINPSDDELTAAAKYGLDGGHPRSRDLCGVAVRAPCGGGFTFVAFLGPVQRAERMGFEARQKFSDAPSLASLRELRGTAIAQVGFCSFSREVEMAIAVEASGEIYRAAKVQSTADLASAICGSLRPWFVGISAEFRPPHVLPAGGDGVLIIRQGVRPDVRINFRFGDL